MAEGAEPQRSVLRLVVLSPDGSRVLARPNGLAGWTLPVLAVDQPFTGWDEATITRAGRVLGVPVSPGEPIGPSAWTMTPEGRLPAVGRTWIGLEELDRLGADAAVLRAWAEMSDERGH